MSFITLDNGMRIESDNMKKDDDGIIRAARGKILLGGREYFFTNLEIDLEKRELSYPSLDQKRTFWSTSPLGDPYEPETPSKV